MNKLLTFDGGQPVYARDLSFMQEALAETTTMLAKTFGETYILYGTVDETRENITAGAVCIAGQIYEVPESLAGAIGTQKLCYRTVDSDERTFYDGQSHNVYRTYQAYLSDSTDGAVAFIDLKTAKTVDRQLSEKVFLDRDKWIEETAIDISGQVEWKNGYSGTVKYKVIGKEVHLFIDVRTEAESWTETGLIFKAESVTELHKLTFMVPIIQINAKAHLYVFFITNVGAALINEVNGDPTSAPVLINGHYVAY